MLSMNQLDGLSVDDAKRYGLPHFGAYYARENVDANRLVSNAKCVVCGKRAHHSHHWPPKGRGRHYTMETPIGMFVLMPSLFAVCPWCHDRWHMHQLTADWEWFSPEGWDRWFAGEILRNPQFPPHSKELYRLGQWVLNDLERGRQWTVSA